MHGNVWEWVQNPISGSMSPARNNVNRLLGGGSFFCLSSDVGSADRNNNKPTTRYSDFGFRLARTLPPIPLTSLPSIP